MIRDSSRVHTRDDDDVYIARRYRIFPQPEWALTKEPSLSAEFGTSSRRRSHDSKDRYMRAALTLQESAPLPFRSILQSVPQRHKMQLQLRLLYHVVQTCTMARAGDYFGSQRFDQVAPRFAHLFPIPSIHLLAVGSTHTSKDNDTLTVSTPWHACSLLMWRYSATIPAERQRDIALGTSSDCSA